jgi:AraC-like DNA-binding protein
MQMQETIFILILAIGIAQGVIIGIVLFQLRSKNLYANRILSFILFFVSYQLLVGLLRYAGFISVENISYHLFLEYDWIYGPLIFFYIKAFIDLGFRIRKKHWIFFLPVIIQFVSSNYIKSQNFYWDGSRESLSWLGYNGYRLWMHTPFVLVITFGLISISVKYSVQLLRKEQIVVRWLKKLLFAFLIVGLIVPIIALIDFTFFDFAFNPFYIYPFYITLAVLIYWMGIMGLMHYKDVIRKAPKSKERTKLEEIMRLIRNAFIKDDDFTSHEFTIQSLSAKINHKPYLISQAINQIHGKSFTDFVNEIRVDRFKELLESEKHQHFTLLALAYEAGFSSKASFNRAVRKFTGKSPSEIKNSIDQQDL